MPIVLTAALLSSGCAIKTISVCPPVIPYTDEFQERAADELEALPDDSAVGVMVEDYLVTRDMLRACNV